jgi:peptidyl-prolyl cis-trans isomerase A (cyclophilin A)
MIYYPINSPGQVKPARRSIDASATTGACKASTLDLPANDILVAEKKGECSMRLITNTLLIAVLLLFAVGSASAAEQAGQSAASATLLNPAVLNEKAPDVYQAKFETTKGNFVIKVTREWAPLGADRFYNLVKNGYYNDCRFFRVISDFMVQFGINGDPKLNTVWRTARIADDPVKKSNTTGYVSFATSGANSRTTQVFINYVDRNSALDKSGFAPFGKISEGMSVVESLYADYGEGAPSGKGPEQGRIQTEGNAYLQKSFPKLDYIKSAVIVPAK